MTNYRWLRITDGQTYASGHRREVDLLNCSGGGFCLQSWTVGIAQAKGGGTWADSALADGRRLKVAKRQNVEHTLTLEVVGQDADDLAYQTQQLRQLLTEAEQYWTSSWTVRPVYIETQGVGESEMGYSLIKFWSTPQGADKYSDAFWQSIVNGVVSELDLTLEVEPYIRDAAPGSDGTCLPLGNIQLASNGEWYGNYDPVSATREQTCAADTVYIANKHNLAQLTHVWYWDAAPGAWSANLLATTLSYSLLPAAPGAGDTLYVGIDNSATWTGPFCSMVYDLIAATGSITFSSSSGAFWQYWNGAWTYIDTQDNTNAAGANTGQPLNTDGPGSIHWLQPDDWSLSTVNGVQAYWMRCVVASVSGTVTAPVQQNRHVYSVLWPYVEVQDAQVGGDVESLLRLFLKNQSTGGSYAQAIGSNQWWAGLRSLGRGSSFTAFLNATDVQQPSGITFLEGTYTAFQDDKTAPTGRSVLYDPNTVQTDWPWLGTWRIASSIANQWFGTFRVFMRIKRTAGSGTMKVRLYCSLLPLGEQAYDRVYSSQIAQVASDTTIYEETLDLGQLSVPPGSILSTDTTGNLEFVADVYSTDATDAMIVYDLIVLPIDEMAFSVQSPNDQGVGLTLGYLYQLDADSVTVPKFSRRATRNIAASDAIYGTYQIVGANELTLQARADQRLWILSQLNTTAYKQPFIEIGHSVQAWNVKRFWWMRGAS